MKNEAVFYVLNCLSGAFKNLAKCAETRIEEFAGDKLSEFYRGQKEAYLTACNIIRDYADCLEEKK